jgi:hypothetical protein
MFGLLCPGAKRIEEQALRGFAFSDQGKPGWKRLPKTIIPAFHSITVSLNARLVLLPLTTTEITDHLGTLWERKREMYVLLGSDVAHQRSPNTYRAPFPAHGKRSVAHK